MTFGDAKTALEAVKKMNNFEFDNRPLGVISDPPRKQRVPVDGEESNKLHVRNLDRNLTKPQIKEKFEKFGNCKVDFKKNSRNCYANITFTEENGKEAAEKAKADLNNTNAFGDTPIIVVYVKNKTQPRAKKTAKKNNKKNQPKQLKEKNKKKAKKVSVAPKKEIKKEPEKKSASSENKEKEKKPWKRRLFVNNLAEGVEKEDVEKLFKQYGAVTNVQLPVDQDSQKIRGFCYVQMQDPEKALIAKEKIHQAKLNGSELEVYWARPRKRKRNTNRINRKGGPKKK